MYRKVRSPGTSCPRIVRPLGLFAAVGAAALSPVSSHARQPDAELGRICAGERQYFVAPPLTTFDSDGDRRISAEEAQDCRILAELFSRLDLDADDALTITEYRAFADVWRRRKRSFDDPQR